MVARGQNPEVWLGAVGDYPSSLQAVRLAEELCQKTQFQQSSYLDTLAVAYAEAGLFEKAVETAQRAIALATQAGDQRAAAEMQGRLELFERKQPYRSE